MQNYGPIYRQGVSALILKRFNTFMLINCPRTNVPAYVLTIEDLIFYDYIEIFSYIVLKMYINKIFFLLISKDTLFISIFNQ